MARGVADGLVSARRRAGGPAPATSPRIASRLATAIRQSCAARLAGAFTAAGLAPNSKVASYLYNSNEYSEGVYATFKMRKAAGV